MAGDSDGKQTFGGIEFGIGLAASFDLGQNERVREAEIVNGLVRVTHSEDVSARMMLESHYFFTPEHSFFGLARNGPRIRPGQTGDRLIEWGWGPFVAVQPGDESLIDAVGAGLMVGFRRSTQPGENQSFNFGVGVVYDINARILGDDIVANEPLPDGETEIRFLTRDQMGLLILSSFSF